MRTLRAIIADDELAARRKLRSMLAKFPQLRIVAEAEDGDTALSLIDKHRPDIAFLDIDMPVLTGMDVAQKSECTKVRIVFVTAYDHYAVQAFDTSAVDYLLKPVNPTRLAQCIEKLNGGHHLSANASKENSHSAASSPEQQLAIRHGAAVRIVELKHIAWLESTEGYCRIHLSKEGQLLHKQNNLIADTSLVQTHSLLPEAQFLRISRASIVNINHVVRHWTEKRQMYISLQGFDNQALPVSRRNASVIRRRWNAL
ncbi:MAG: response regulator transcription factor [Pseudomonadota bacterium]